MAEGRGRRELVKSEVIRATPGLAVMTVGRPPGPCPSLRGTEGPGHTLLRSTRTKVTESDGHHADPDRQRAEPDVRPPGSGPAVGGSSRTPNLESGARPPSRANRP